MHSNSSKLIVVASAALVCAVLGSVHAFSVFLQPLETDLKVGRASASLTYSIALASLTFVVLIGPRFYVKISPQLIFLIVGIVGTAGALIAASSNSVFGIWFGYGVTFGAANGLGYGFSLQYAARAMPKRSGTAMGVITAAYALGAAVSPALFNALLEADGFPAAMAVLAAAVLLVSAIAAWVTWTIGIEYSSSKSISAADLPPFPTILRIWLMYGSAVAAGLMAIGHAAGIATQVGLTPWVAPAVLAICNFAGSFAGGALADRISHSRILPVIPLISAAGLLTLTGFPSLTLFALGVVGFAYGSTIAAYPAIISQWFPGDAGPRVYSKVFTAWGTAGLFAPWLAGYLFDLSDSYKWALFIAAALATTSAVMAKGFGRK